MPQSMVIVFVALMARVGASMVISDNAVRNVFFMLTPPSCEVERVINYVIIEPVVL